MDELEYKYIKYKYKYLLLSNELELNGAGKELDLINLQLKEYYSNCNTNKDCQLKIDELKKIQKTVLDKQKILTQKHQELINYIKKILSEAKKLKTDASNNISKFKSIQNKPKLKSKALELKKKLEINKQLIEQFKQKIKKTQQKENFNREFDAILKEINKLLVIPSLPAQQFQSPRRRQQPIAQQAGPLAQQRQQPLILESKAIPSLLKSENVDNYIWYFAYGSNSSKQLKERLNVSNDFERKATKLKNWIRIFHGKSMKWGGSVASIKEKTNSYVNGILFKLTKDQLDKLSEFEKGYELKIFDSSNFENSDRDVYTFIKNKDNEQDNPPSEEYLKAIARLLKERRQLLRSLDTNNFIIDYNNKDGIFIKQFTINYNLI